MRRCRKVTTVPKKLFEIPHLFDVREFFEDTFLIHTKEIATCCLHYRDEVEAACSRKAQRPLMHDPHFMIDEGFYDCEMINCSAFLKNTKHEGLPKFVGLASSFEGDSSRFGFEHRQSLFCILAHEECDFGRKQLFLFNEKRDLVAQVCATPVCFSGFVSFLCWNTCTFSTGVENLLLMKHLPAMVNRMLYHSAVKDVMEARRKGRRCCNIPEEERQDPDSSGYLSYIWDFENHLEDLAQTRREEKKKKKSEAAEAAAAAAPPPPSCCKTPELERAYCPGCQECSACRRCCVAAWKDKRQFVCSQCGITAKRLPRFYDPATL